MKYAFITAFLSVGVLTGCSHVHNIKRIPTSVDVVTITQKMPIGEFKLTGRGGDCPFNVKSDGLNLINPDGSIWANFRDFSTCSHVVSIGSKCLLGPNSNCGYDYCFIFPGEIRSVSFGNYRITVELEKIPGNARTTTRCIWDKVLN